MARRRNWIIQSWCMMLVATLPAICSYPTGAADIHTVAAWTFDEGKGDITEDVSGNGHDGTLMNGAKWSKEGKIGGCTEFDGVESYVEVPHNDSLNLKAFTIEAWIKVGPKAGNHSIMHKAGPGGNLERNYILNVLVDNNGILRASFTANGAQQNFDGVTGVMDETWHHVAASYDGDVGRIYVDGELDSEIRMGFELEPNDSPLAIGKAGFQSGRFAGLMDEVRLSNIARPIEDIRELMNRGLSEILSVKAAGKLTTTWGVVKSTYKQL